MICIALVSAVYFFYQPPLLDRGGRNILERLFDFFAYSWHFSRQAWLEEKRDWIEAGREKLLSAWYRPSIIGTWGARADISLFDLGWEFEKRSLLDRAAAVYLQSHLNAVSDLRLAEKVAFRLSRLGAWKKLAIVGENMADEWPDYGGGKYWLKVARKQSLPKNEFSSE